MYKRQVLGASDLSVIEKHGGHQVHFDELSIPAVFQQGTLRWSSARMIGEDLSILGNGQVSVRQGVTAVSRVVVSPEIAAELRRAMFGAIGGKSIGWAAWWEDLDTPDRKYRDIYLTGDLHDPQVDLGKNHGELPLWNTLASTLQFIRVEMKEEGVDLGPYQMEIY